jgi:hypothetical protein
MPHPPAAAQDDFFAPARGPRSGIIPPLRNEGGGAHAMKSLGSLLVAVALVIASADGQDKTGKDKTPGKDKIDPEKLKPDAAKVKFQTEKAEKYYAECYEVPKVPLHESAHFLVVGTLPGKSSALIAESLETAYVKACKALELDKDPGPWPGKLTIFLLHEAKEYSQLVRLAQRRKPDEDEHGSRSIDGTIPHIVACPHKAAGELGVPGTACTQMVALLMEYKLKGQQVPAWLGEGFGRATALHVFASGTLAAERRKAAAFITKNNRTASDVIDNNLKAEETPVLRFSLADYLAYSGKTGKFLPLLQGFGLDAKGNPGNLDAALKSANLTREELNNNWVKYAKSFK